MKKLLLLFSLFCMWTNVRAQMSEWTIRPDYDSIHIANGAPLLICDSLNFTCSSLWTLDGKQLALTYDSIHSFSDGYAITTKRGTMDITGFFDVKGNFTKVDDLSVIYNMSLFYSGLLVTRSTTNYRNYNIIDANNKTVKSILCKNIYPYTNGYAVTEVYDDYERKKDSHFGYLTSDFGLVSFTYGKKVFEPKDVRFLTSVTDEGISFAVIKDDLYIYNVNTKELLPVTANINDNNPKKQVSLVEQDNGSITFNYKDTTCVVFKKRKNERVYLFLDDRLVPIKIRYSENENVSERLFVKNVKQDIQTVSDLSIFKDNRKFGILCKGDTILPAQFDDAKFCSDNFAVVRMSKGKWGMLNYDEEKSFVFRIHDNKDIGFRHSTFKTEVRLSLPESMTSEKCRFYINKNSGCVIDRTTKRNADTDGGNWVEYDCELLIPHNLTDAAPIPIYYPATLIYDDIIHPVYNVVVNAWHRKSINVNIDDSNAIVTKGNVSFTIEFDIEKRAGDSNDYPFTVYVDSRNLKSELLKMTETRYKCTIDSLVEGVNVIYVIVEEVGCPKQITPFDITYVKPVKVDDDGKVMINERVKGEVPVENKKDDEKKNTGNAQEGEVILEQ